MSTASRESTAGAPAVRPSALMLLQAGAAVVVGGGFVLMAVKGWGQIERLVWRPAELTHALSAAVSLATTFPVRFLCLVLGSVGLMLAAEYRPRSLLRLSTAAWVSLGVAGTGAYLLSALDVGSRWAFALLLAASVAGAGLLLVRRGLDHEPPGAPAEPVRGRLVLPVLVGLVGGLLAVRASIEPVTEWDAVIYHVSFARDWLDSLPGLPHAAGPSVGAELSYNYPALFPSVSVVVASALHVGVDSVARLVSPLAAVTVLAALRSVAPRGLFSGWAASMFLLGSTFFVAYGQWPTAYMLMTVLVTLAVARLVTERRLMPATALCLGLAAATGLIGVVVGSIVMVAYVGVALVARRSKLGGLRLPATGRIGGLAALLAAPLIVVGIGSVRRTHGLLFPWITWPSSGHLLPEPYWRFTRDEILANSYGQFDAPVGSFFAPIRGVASAGVLAPGGLALAVVIVLACAIARPGSRRVLAVGGGIVAASIVVLVAAELLWLRYFLPLSVAGAALLGVAVAVLRSGSGSPALLERVNGLAYLAGWVAAVTAVASGAAYALAGPNDRTYTAATDYAAARSSAFESARRAADGPARLVTVFGDDARAWSDLVTLGATGLSVGTFDIRNATTHYVPRLQLDGLAGASITGSSGSAVARSLKENGIDAVFVPAWFWEPGPGRDPLADWSPVALWVGSPPLRALRVYLPDEGTTYASVLYAVGSAADRARIARALDTPSFSIEGPLSTRRTVVPGGYRMSGLLGGRLYWRVAAPVTESGGPSIRLTTEDVADARGVAVFEPRLPTLVQAASFVDCTGVEPWARRSTVDVTFPGSPLGFAYLDIAAPRPSRRLAASVRRIPAGPDSVLVRGCGDPTTTRGGVFPARSSAARIIVEHRPGTNLALDFDYLDAGRRGVSFNLYDGFRDRWEYGVARLARCGSGGWVHARLPIHIPRAAAGIETVELGPVVNGRDLIVRNLRLVPGARQTDCETMRG